MTATFHPIRTPIVLPVAAAVTAGLFVLMNNLIDTGPWAPEPVDDLPPVQIRFEPDEPLPDERMPIEVIPPVEAPPPLPRPDTSASAVDGAPAGVSWTLPPMETRDISGGSGLVPAERSPVPTVRVNPAYPPSAASRGLEGQCTVIFDITPQGTTANVRTLSCTSSTFERASLNAVSRWRYNPQIRDGQPVMFRGATTQLVYSMDG
jgi:protein TonB